MKTILRRVPLAVATLFGVISALQVVSLTYIYIETYRLPPPPFPVPLYQRFPIYTLNGDLKDVAPLIFAFICCFIAYVRSDKSDQ